MMGRHLRRWPSLEDHTLPAGLLVTDPCAVLQSQNAVADWKSKQLLPFGFTRYLNTEPTLYQCRASAGLMPVVVQ